MLMPGFSAESVFALPRKSTRQTGGGGHGPIVIEGSCECVEWKRICLGPIGGFCLPIVGCIPSIEFCWDQCVTIRCKPA